MTTVLTTISLPLSPCSCMRCAYIKPPPRPLSFWQWSYLIFQLLTSPLTPFMRSVTLWIIMNHSSTCLIKDEGNNLVSQVGSTNGGKMTTDKYPVNLIIGNNAVRFSSSHQFSDNSCDIYLLFLRFKTTTVLYSFFFCVVCISGVVGLFLRYDQTNHVF